VTGRRRRVSRRTKGSRREQSWCLLVSMAGHQKRLPSGGTNARSVGAALDLYREAATSGSLDLSPNTISTTRSAIRVMNDMEPADGRQFGPIRLSLAHARTRALRHRGTRFERSLTTSLFAIRLATQEGTGGQRPSLWHVRGLLVDRHCEAGSFGRWATWPSTTNTMPNYARRSRSCCWNEAVSLLQRGILACIRKRSSTGSPERRRSLAGTGAMVVSTSKWRYAPVRSLDMRCCTSRLGYPDRANSFMWLAF
jgi:hypothetical protein